jgi:hypothetical protein
METSIQVFENSSKWHLDKSLTSGNETLLNFILFMIVGDAALTGDYRKRAKINVIKCNTVLN